MDNILTRELNQPAIENYYQIVAKHYGEDSTELREEIYNFILNLNNILDPEFPELNFQIFQNPLTADEEIESFDHPGFILKPLNIPAEEIKDLVTEILKIHEEKMANFEEFLLRPATAR